MRPLAEPLGGPQTHFRRVVQKPVHGDPAARRLFPTRNLVGEGCPHLLRQDADPLVELPMQVMLVELHHRAQPLDFRVRVEGQPPGLRQLVHLHDQALDQRRRRFCAGAGIGPRQIVGRRWIEAIRGDQHVDRPRHLVHEHRAHAAAAFLVLPRRADQRLEEVKAAFSIGVLLTDRVPHQDRRDALRPEQRNPVRFRYLAGNAEFVGLTQLVQARPGPVPLPTWQPPSLANESMPQAHSTTQFRTLGRRLEGQASAFVALAEGSAPKRRFGQAIQT